MLASTSGRSAGSPRRRSQRIPSGYAPTTSRSALAPALQCPVPAGRTSTSPRPTSTRRPRGPPSTRGLAARDPQHLVSGGVEVVEGIDAVPPGAAPAVAGEERLAAIPVRGRLDPAVDEHGQGRVRDAAVVAEDERLGLHRGQM